MLELMSVKELGSGSIGTRVVGSRGGAAERRQFFFSHGPHTVGGQSCLRPLCTQSSVVFSRQTLFVQAAECRQVPLLSLERP